jgi:transposase
MLPPLCCARSVHRGMPTWFVALAREVLAEVRLVERSITELEQQLEATLAATGTSLLQLHGVGSVVAATRLGHSGDLWRFPTAGHLAASCGVAPLEASSGDVARHRLSGSAIAS